ncbi:hypothetical protein CWB31_15380 [Bacillus cereus]|nr:hypothetical protein [Bacillus cereus]MDR4154665.1 hypothetical protein [Bacillus cereus]
MHVPSKVICPLSFIGFIIAFLVWVVILLMINRVFNLRIYQNFIKCVYNYEMGGISSCVLV